MADEIRRLSDDLARDPSSLVFMRLADALRRAGQLDVALRVALRGLDRHPYLPDAHDVLARIHADRGDLERASDEWEMALRLDPSHAQANLGLGFVDFAAAIWRAPSVACRPSRLRNRRRRVAAALAHVRSALGAHPGKGTAVVVPNGSPPAEPVRTSPRSTPLAPSFRPRTRRARSRSSIRHSMDPISTPCWSTPTGWCSPERTPTAAATISPR